MIFKDEGMATRNGQSLNIQCLKIDAEKSNPDETQRRYHYHKYNELIYMLDGEMDVYIYDSTHRCITDDFIIIYTGEPHTFFFHEDCSYIVIKFLPEILSTFEQTLNEFEYVYNMSNIISERIRLLPGANEIGALICDAFDRFVSNEYADELLVRADIIRVCALILKEWHKRGEISSLNGKISGENLKIISRIIDDTVKRCGNIKTHHAASICGFSDGYFSRLFKSVTGKTFSDFTRLVKMDEAVRLLQCTDESITQISQRLGYATSSHFIEDFKRLKGITPKRLRRKI